MLLLESQLLTKLNKYFIKFIIFILYMNCKDIKKPDLLFSILLPDGIMGVITSDFRTSGNFYTISSEGILSLTSIPIHSDATGFSFENEIAIVNRLQRDSIQILDKRFFFLTKIEYSTGNGSNPHGIAYWGDKAYITLYETNYILVVNRFTGYVLNRIDLNSHTDNVVYSIPDGLPEQSGIIAYNNKIYVALQRLDRNNPNFIYPVTDYSILLEIDPVTDTIENSYRYIYKNPISKLKLYNIEGNDCIVSANAGNVGFNFEIDGGIEAFCFPSKNSIILLPETEVGGDILDVVIKNDTEGYAMVEFEDFSMGIFKFNPTLAKVTKSLLIYSNIDGFAAGLALSDDGKLWLGESSRFPTIRVYESNNDFLLNIISLPERPFDIFSL